MEHNLRNRLEHEKKCRSFKADIGPFRLSLNPVVTLLSALVIWAFVIVCIALPDKTMNAMSLVTTWISTTATWFYIGTKSVWVVFIAIIYFSKYSKIKLGKDDDEPEFSDLSYFTMLFAAAVGIGLYYYGVAEPVLHYQPGPYRNRFWGRHNDNQRATDAMNLAFFHWGLHGWVVYVIVALLLGYVSYRKGLPMTIRSCFYPILGDKIFGLAGDVIDTLSVVGTMFGVCTTLGMGVITINTGLNRVNNNIAETLSNQIIIIWVITAVATLSVVSGLKVGIRRLSEICFGLGMFLCLFVLFRGDTWYHLNVYVQGFGYYLQNMIQLSFHTDAYAQLNNAEDGKENPNWLEGWTIFYWGWWMSWSPFVGMFIAKISRGRTIRNFLNFTLTAPMIYAFFWFSIFGGAGLKMERDAAKLGINCSSTLGGTNSTEPFQGLFRLSCRSDTQMLFDVIQGFDKDLTTFLYIITLSSIVLYFVTSSDSGSLVIDCLSANGNPDPPITQRVFWALTEGACATALLTTGGTDALKALRGVSVAAALPYTVIVCFMCVSLWNAIQAEGNTERSKTPEFHFGLLYLINKPFTLNKFFELVLSIVFPWWYAGQVSGTVYRQSSKGTTIVMAITFNCFLLLEILQIVQTGFAYIGWVLLIGFFTHVVSVGVAVKSKFGIQGSIFMDFLTVICLYPFAVNQLYRQVKFEEHKKSDSHQISMNNVHDTKVEEEKFLDEDSQEVS